MRTQSSAGHLTGPTPAAALPCGFGMCPEPATRTVETRAPIGRTVEWLCQRHAERRAEHARVLRDDPIALDDVDQPIPFRLTSRGLTAIDWGAA